ncbi:hypothetical protein NKR23_g7004 [Pleurostoma richardsiae]|jgi:hypothetical protein|uniref:Uncharacterized protein n=1 Tax=Pleurostoma richardsiae TaxID=41990 RepID=A0AA38RXC0_9PEZI|nr:hypothetical protein NKR23_g7004 [Pleurostoma richardsiae]
MPVVTRDKEREDFEHLDAGSIREEIQHDADKSADYVTVEKMDAGINTTKPKQAAESTQLLSHETKDSVTKRHPHGADATKKEGPREGQVTEAEPAPERGGLAVDAARDNRNESEASLVLVFAILCLILFLGFLKPIYEWSFMYGRYPRA